MKFRSLTPSSDLESQVQLEHQQRRPGRAGRQAAALHLARRAAAAAQRAARRHVAGRPAARSGRTSWSSSSRTYAGYADRHRVPAGITGWAQIHGLRGDTSIEERVRFDNHYIETLVARPGPEDHCSAPSARCSASTGSDGDDGMTAARRPRRWRSAVRPGVALCAAGLAARRRSTRRVRRPSFVVAARRAAGLPAQRPAATLGAGAITVADLAAGCVVAVLAVAAARRRPDPRPARLAAVRVAHRRASPSPPSAATDVGRERASGSSGTPNCSCWCRSRSRCRCGTGSTCSWSPARSSPSRSSRARSASTSTLTGTGASYAGQYVRAVGTFGAEQVLALGALIGYGLVVTLALGAGADAAGPGSRLLAASAVAAGLPLALSLSRGAWIATACAVVVLLVIAWNWRVAAVLSAGGPRRSPFSCWPAGAATTRVRRPGPSGSPASSPPAAPRTSR